jgi:hypothetical protein
MLVVYFELRSCLNAVNPFIYHLDTVQLRQDLRFHRPLTVSSHSMEFDQTRSEHCEQSKSLISYQDRMNAIRKMRSPIIWEVEQSEISDEENPDVSPASTFGQRLHQA